MERKNFLLTIILSLIILAIWQFFYINPQIEKKRNIQEIENAIQTDSKKKKDSFRFDDQKQSDSFMSPEKDLMDHSPSNNTNAESEEIRIPIETANLSGSIRLKGTRIDDLKLKNYKLSVDEHSPIISLLKPERFSDGYFVDIGLMSEDQSFELPASQDIVWEMDEKNSVLTASTPVRFSFSNHKGIILTRTISIDDRYMFTISDTVQNDTQKPVTFSQYGRIKQFREVVPVSNFILHEGPISFNEKQGLQEFSYQNIEEIKRSLPEKSSDGWIGITDKYWGVTLIPSSGHQFQPRFSYFSEQKKGFQADFISQPLTLSPGASQTIKTMVFAGAKEVDTISHYQKNLQIKQFDLIIDWGWFYFITKPMFNIIDIFHKLLGNFGLAIIATTILIKIVFFPLANKSYKSMANMKKIQPKLLEIKNKYPNDKVKQHQAIIELYKKEKINPVAGCWPILIQIPIFFALYKVLYVTIEMRHAPFFGWIKDLAAPDPTSFVNLFGLLNFTPNGFFIIGVWPIIMGITMFLQMRMNPTPPDPTQAIIFNWMPVVFTFMLATFPAGLVIYWTWNNIFSIIQQAIIMHMHGTKIYFIDVFIRFFCKKK